MRALEWLKRARAVLGDSEIREPEKESLEILKRFGMDMVSIYRDNPEISDEKLKSLNTILKRRCKREPLQYILGITEFLSLKIKVRHGVLIPRPETELLALEVIKNMKEIVNPIILDLCTGTGAIALQVARELRNSYVYGVDISEVAILCAMENKELNGIRNTEFLRSDLFEIFYDKDILFDAIVANPPYIKTSEIPFLEPEVKNWEPHEALDGGEDGMIYYRRIIRESPRFLKEAGLIFLELGEGLYKDVVSLAKFYSFTEIELIKDLSGIERILKAKKE